MTPLGYNHGAGCLACGGSRWEVFLELPRMPAFCNVLHPSAEAAREAERGDLVLAVCHQCGHLFNRAFQPRKLAYSGHYENSLHRSPRFQAYAEGLAAELTDRYDLKSALVVEIACGQGEFLRTLCTQSGCRGLGYDPSYRRAPNTQAVGNQDAPLRILAEPFDATRLTALLATGERPALILCRQALEHFEEPRNFLTQLGSMLPGKDPTSLFFEVPNSLYSLHQGGIWDFIYEHVSYFCGSSLATCFRHAGYQVQLPQPGFGGQFLSIAARWPGAGSAPAPAATHGRALADQAILDDILTAARALGDEVRTRTRTWRERLHRLRAGGRQAAVWGAGSKGATFLNLIEAHRDLVRVIDINPRKQGMHVAGVGIPIEAPQALVRQRPARVLVMNPLYVEEIQGQLRDMGVEAEVEAV